MYQIEAKTRLAYETSFVYKQNPQDFSSLEQHELLRKNKSLTKQIDKSRISKSNQMSPENIKCQQLQGGGWGVGGTLFET